MFFLDIKGQLPYSNINQGVQWMGSSKGYGGTWNSIKTKTMDYPLETVGIQ